MTSRNAAEKSNRINVDFKIFCLLGMSAILFFAPLFRGLFFPQEYLPAIMAVAVVFLLMALDQWNRRDTKTNIGYMDLAVILYALIYLLTNWVAVSIHDALTTTLKVFAYVLVYLTVSRVIRSMKDWLFLLKAIFIANIAVAAVGLGASLHIFNYPGAFNGKFILSTYQYPNTLGVAMVISTIAGIYLWVQSSSTIGKSFYAVGIILQGITLVASYSKGALLMFPLAMVLLLMGTPREYFWQLFANQTASIFVILFASRFFFPNMVEGQVLEQGTVLVLASLAIILYVFLSSFYSHLLNRFDFTEKTKSIIATGIIVYLFIVVFAYIFYASQVLPNVYAQFAPASVLNEMQSINANDFSKVGRVNMYRDAVDMVKDYPVLGTGGGGWNALYHRYQDELYWTTEVHNHFLQTWVEAGTLGFLTYISIWIMAFIYIYRLFFWRWRGLEPEQWLIAWTTAVLIIILGIHSFIDFDLSLPAVSILLWTLFGMIRGGTNIFIPKDRFILFDKVPSFFGGISLKLTTAILLTALVFLPANFMFRAGKAAALGAQAMAVKNIQPAEVNMEKAHKLDPYHPSYMADLSQVYAAKYLMSRDKDLAKMARETAKKANASGKYNVRVQQALVNSNLLLGDLPKALEHTRRIVEINPLDVSSYEMLSAYYFSAGVRLMKAGQVEEAKKALEEAVKLPKQLETAIQSISPDPAVRWQGRALEVTPMIKLTQGQALILLNRYQQSINVLKEIENEKQVAGAAKALAETLEQVLAGEKTSQDIYQLLGLDI